MKKKNGTPSGWEKCKYGDLLEYIQPSKYIVDSVDYNDNYEIPVLTAGKSFIKGYTNEKHGVFDEIPAIIFDDFTTASKFVNFRFKVKSSAMKILVPCSNLVNLKFIYYCMQASRVRSDTHKRYWISVYAEKELLLPPLLEQDRIVAKIEELFTELDKGVESLKTAREQLKVYRQAVLKHAFEGKLTERWREENKEKLETADQLLDRIKREREVRSEQQLEEWKDAVKKWESDGKQDKKPTKPRLPKEVEAFQNSDLEGLTQIPSGWRWARMHWIAETTGGFAFKSSEFCEEGNWQVVKMGNVKMGEFQLDQSPAYLKEVTEQVLQNYLLKEADSVITMTGTRKKRDYGFVAYVKTEKNLLLNQRLTFVRFSEMVDPLFCHYVMRSKQFQNNFFEQETGNVGQGNVGMKAISDAIIPVPQLLEQIQIAKLVEQNLSQADYLFDEVERNLSNVDALRQSILKQAFSGQLVEQNPNDEPASVLLERINAGQDGQAKGQKKNNKRKDAA